MAHVDHTIERLLRLTHDYTEHGTVTFAEVSKGDRVDVVVQEVALLAPLVDPQGLLMDEGPEDFARIDTARAKRR